MKKTLWLVLILSFAYPQTGNDFLKRFPFSKKIGEFRGNDMYDYIHFTSQLEGIVFGNALTLRMLGHSGETEALFYRTCGMPLDQKIRIIKKWCNDNPSQTHKSFDEIVFLCLFKLPIKSLEECGSLIKSMN